MEAAVKCFAEKGEEETENLIWTICPNLLVQSDCAVPAEG
jgi:hypothetical protein